MLEIIHEVVPHDAANIALLDENKKMHFVKLKGYEKFKSKKAIESLNYSIHDILDFETMAEKNEAIVVADTQNNPAWVANPEVTWIRSYVGSPIVVNGRTIGFINVDSSIPNFYNQEHAQRLKVFADEAAIAIQNARIVEELKERNQDLSTLYEVGLSMTKGLDNEEIIRGLMKQIENFKGIDLVYLLLFNEEPQKDIFYFYGADERILHNSEVTGRLPGFINEIWYKKNTLYLPDHEEKEILQWLAGEEPSLLVEMHTYLGIPLFTGKRADRHHDRGK